MVPDRLAGLMLRLSEPGPEAAPSPVGLLVILFAAGPVGMLAAYLLAA